MAAGGKESMGDGLKCFREAVGTSQWELSPAVGIPAGTIRNGEQASASPASTWPRRSPLPSGSVWTS